MRKRRMTKKAVKKKHTMEWEKKAAPILLPPDVLQKKVEEFAEAVRDKVNSYAGAERLSISLFHPFSDQSVSILYKDTDAPEGSDSLCIGWSDGCDVDGTVSLILEGCAEEEQPTENDDEEV